MRQSFVDYKIIMLIFNKRDLDYIFLFIGHDQYRPQRCPPLITSKYILQYPGTLAFRISVPKTVRMNALKSQPIKLVEFYVPVEAFIYIAPNASST